MHKRIKWVRDYKNMTQQEFADKLGIKRGTLANYEVGRNEPIDAVITLICSKFGIRKQWLVDGEGEPLIELSREAQIAEWVGEVMSDAEPSDRRAVLAAVRNATPQELSAIVSFARRLAAEYEAEQNRAGIKKEADSQ